MTELPLFLFDDKAARWHLLSRTLLWDTLRYEADFAQHEAFAKTLGFVLDVRRSKPQYNRSHIRVRPRFDRWRCVCEVHITDEVLSDALVLQLFQMAGRHKGIGNWRPSVGKAGSYGQFDAEIGLPHDLHVALEHLEAAPHGVALA